MPDLPELKTGDKVITTFTKYGEIRVSGTYEIERETKTLLIVNGSKFRKRDHQEHISRDIWSGRSEIIPAGSVQAQELLKAKALAAAKENFRHCVNRWSGSLTDLENARVSKNFLNTYIGLLEKEATK